MKFVPSWHTMAISTDQRDDLFCPFGERSCHMYFSGYLCELLRCCPKKHNNDRFGYLCRRQNLACDPLSRRLGDQNDDLRLWVVSKQVQPTAHHNTANGLR